MKCETVDHFSGSSARPGPSFARLWHAAQRGLTGQLALAALVVLPVRAAAEDPPAAPQVAPPAEAPPPPPRDLPEPPPPQVIESGAVPGAGEDGPPPWEELPPTEDGPRFDSPGTPLTAAPPKAPPVDGQWVYTDQYGWVWMPYSESYTYVPSDGYPAMYLYGPTFGWRWVAAPWVFDTGPRPYWGVRGRASFVWYSRPWFTHRVYVGPRYSYGPRYYDRDPRRGGRGYDRGRGGRREVIIRGSGRGHSHGGGHRH
jgi:hypothetical protein